MNKTIAGVSLILAFGGPALGAKVSLEQGAEAGLYRVAGQFNAAAASSVAWDVLTDYDGIGGFVSSIEASRVIRRGPGGALIEQRGSGRFLFVTRQVTLTLEVREERPGLVEFRDVDAKQFKKYEGSWRIEPSSGGCLVSYELTAQPNPSLGPRFAAKSVLRRNVRRLLEEVRAEMERRAKRVQEDARHG